MTDTNNNWRLDMSDGSAPPRIESVDVRADDGRPLGWSVDGDGRLHAPGTLCGAISGSIFNGPDNAVCGRPLHPKWLDHYDGFWSWSWTEGDPYLAEEKP